MSTYRQRMNLELVRGLNARISFEIKLTRSSDEEIQVDSAWEEVEEKDAELERLRKTLENKDENIQKWRQWSASKDEIIKKLRRQVDYEKSTGRQRGFAQSQTIKPENVVWLFGTPRVGSTWLATMMEEMRGSTCWHEPLVGEAFGWLYYTRAKDRRGMHFLLGDKHKVTWLNSIRSFVLDGATVRFPEMMDAGTLVIKEPNGSVGAPLMVEALPESRMIFLVRDPRDVVSSVLDSIREDSWMHRRKERAEGRYDSRVDEQPEAFARRRANLYNRDMSKVKQAYEEHKGPKVLVRYEDLVSDTMSVMQHIHSELGIPADKEEIQRVVEKHSWANIPEEKKGEGKFYRKGTSGGWKEDLTPGQVEIVEQISAPFLEEFYPETGAAPRDS